MEDWSNPTYCIYFFFTKVEYVDTMVSLKHH